MSNSQRVKGAGAEREVVEMCQCHGVPARRGYVQLGQPDVVGVHGIHVEVKRQETVKLNAWMQQAEADAEKRKDGIPTVWHRRNRERWKVTLNADDFLELYKHAIKGGYANVTERNRFEAFTEMHAEGDYIGGGL